MADKLETGKTYLKPDDGKCLHYYFYFIDEDLGFARLLVVPWLISWAGLHGREDGDQPGVGPPLGQYGLHQVLFADVLLADVLDRNPTLGGQPLRVQAKFFAEGLGKAWVVKDPHLVCV